MVDKTTDISNKEQAVICFRWVSDDLIVHEDFVGLYGTENIEAQTLVNMIFNVLTRLNLSIKMLRGQFYEKTYSHNAFISNITPIKPALDTSLTMMHRVMLRIESPL